MRRTFSRVAALPGAGRARPGRAQEARRAERLPRGLVGPRSTRRTCSSTRRSRRRPGPLLEIQEMGRSGREGRLPDPGRRLHGGRARQVREGRAAAGGDPLRDSPFKERRADFNVWGLCPPSRRVRHLAAVDRHPPPLAGRRHLRRLRLRALRADLRQPRLPRRRLVRALRVRRDPDQHPHLRRRRHLRPLPHRGRGQPVGALRLRPRVRPPLRRAGRRVLHLGRRLRAGAGPGRAVGAERHRAPRSGGSSSGRTWSTPGTPLPTPWDKEAFEKHSREIQKRRRKIRAENRPEEEMDALFLRAAGGGDEAALRPSRTPARWARSRARSTRRGATTGRRPTASCSPATGAVLRGLPRAGSSG